MREREGLKSWRRIDISSLLDRFIEVGDASLSQTQNPAERAGADEGVATSRLSIRCCLHGRSCSRCRRY